MKERYGNQVPWILRLLGVWGFSDNCWRCTWGEISWKLGFSLGYSVCHEKAHINIHLIYPDIFINMPMVIKQRPGTEDWGARFGVWYHARAFQCCWRTACKILHLPWDFDHVRSTWLNEDGSVFGKKSRGEYKPPAHLCRTFPYTYTRLNGEVQQRTATVHGDVMEWRWRWFKWLPWPRRIRRSINIEFNDEVGERTGSWKGGCIGCGYDWRENETMEQCLRRMERERKF